MPFVTVEVDIAADGSIQAAPNPVRVRSGQKLFFHVNSNASKKKRFSVTFPGGPQSPFGEGETTVDVAAVRCLGGGSHVDWPPDVHRATVRLAAHSSPASDILDLEVLRDDTMLLAPAGGGQQIVQNFYMGHAAHRADLISAGPQSAHLLERKSTDCGPPSVSAGPTWGPWAASEAAAITAALKRVNDACVAQCSGGCKTNQSCKFLNESSSTPEIEEREVNAQKEYRAKASMSGKCQCE